MSQRFYVDPPIASKEIALQGSEAHHLLHVHRARPEQLVTLFDGSGREFSARIVECGRREVRLHVESCEMVSREPRLSLTLGVALPKGDRQRWLTEKAVELGVASLMPLITEHGVSRPTASALERLRRAVIEASKQCGRTRLMQIAEPVDCREFFADPPGTPDGDALLICAHPNGERPAPMAGLAVAHVSLAIGPEGGFADEEVRTARESGWTIASLGPRTFRVETAALALAALFTLDRS
jgi:16S rRNA (uracil1498-N3)-methyltransferase